MIDNPARIRFAPFQDYRNARSVLEIVGTRNKIGHNTYIEEDADGNVSIRLHKTRIVMFHPDDSITLNSGGYLTATTKARMNAVLPPGLRVYQDKGDWYVSDRDTTIPFSDGMRVRYTPTVRDNPMRRPSSDWDWRAAGWSYSIPLSEAQAIWDRAYRKGDEPDPRKRFLAEARRKAKGGLTRKDYERAIKAPIDVSREHYYGPEGLTYQQLEDKYRDRPLDIWEDNPMQRVNFSNGGFALHKITHLADAKMSAWYDASGELLDAEYIDRLGRSRPVLRGGPLWEQLRALGRQQVAR